MPPYGIAQFSDQVYSDPYNITAEDKIIQQPMGYSGFDRGIPFALPNLDYRNYDLSNLFNRNQTIQPDFINAPQDEYASLYSSPELDTSRFKGMDLEPGYLDRAGSYGQDVYSEKPKGGGIGGLFRFLVGLAVPGAGFLMNLPGKGLEGIRSLNQRLRATDFGQSKTLQEYMSRRRERDAIARAQEAAPSVYESARDQGFTGPRGGFSTTGRYNESAFSSTKSSRGRQDF